MGGPPPPAVAQPPPPVVVTTQPPPVPAANSSQMAAESIRRQNAARAAAGYQPVVRPPSTVVPAVVPQQLPPPTNFVPPPPQQQQLPQALKPNTPPNFKQQLPTSVPTLAQKQQAQQQEHMQRQQHSQMIRQQQQGAIAQSNISAINAAIHQSSQPTIIQQPTQRPSWSEARLSTMEIPNAATASSTSKSASTTNKKQDIYGKVSLAPILGEKLQTLCNSIDPSYTLDSEVQERLVEMADSFVDKVTKDAIKLAKHRGSNCMDVVDVALALKKGFNMSVPGLGPPSVAGSATSGGGGTNMMGGWLFADKVNAEGEQPPSKKRKTSGSAAAAASM